jgi:hypothetical protein
MASMSLRTWHDARLPRLDGIEAAHRAMGGPARGRRFATLQINHSYVMSLSSQFQGFCRDLHSESVAHLVARITVDGSPQTDIRQVLAGEFVLERRLDVANPTPANIGQDFNRLGVDFWGEVLRSSGRHISARREGLQDLILWRNAIAHQDFAPRNRSGRAFTFAPYLTVVQVRRWRAACERLAETFDEVMAAHLSAFIGSPPW